MDLVGAGFSLAELAEMPLDSWTALYAQVQARRLEDAALAVSTTHASKPKKMRQGLIEGAARVAAGYMGGTVQDPAKLRRMIANIPGVKVERAEEDQAEKA